MNILFINGKGGVGKSTMCFLSALVLKEAGKSVSVEDLDPQKSITSWIDRDRDDIPEQGGDCHLVDTPPAIADAIVHNAIPKADRIIMPCSPSPGDINAARASVQVINEMKREDAKVFIVLNMVKQGTNLTKLAPDVLESLGIPVLKTSIPDKQCIQRAVLRGWKALDPQTQSLMFKLAIEVIS